MEGAFGPPSFWEGALRPALHRVGNSQSPVVVIDEFTGDGEAVAAFADALAPFAAIQHNYYPGVRRLIVETDAEATAYVNRTCELAAQFIAGAFDVDGFDLPRPASRW